MLNIYKLVVAGILFWSSEYIFCTNDGQVKKGPKAVSAKQSSDKASAKESTNHTSDDNPAETYNHYLDKKDFAVSIANRHISCSLRHLATALDAQDRLIRDPKFDFANFHDAAVSCKVAPGSNQMGLVHKAFVSAGEILDKTPGHQPTKQSIQRVVTHFGLLSDRQVDSLRKRAEPAKAKSLSWVDRLQKALSSYRGSYGDLDSSDSVLGRSDRSV